MEWMQRIVEGRDGIAAEEAGRGDRSDAGVLAAGAPPLGAMVEAAPHHSGYHPLRKSASVPRYTASARCSMPF